MDTEDAIAPGEKIARDGLTDAVRRVREALPRGATVGYDVGWLPGIDGRFYDFVGIAGHADYLLIMAYDMASYIFGACVATPNSPPPQVLQGLLNYMAVVDPSQLILALPWYGRVYPCIDGTEKVPSYIRLFVKRCPL